ncbi:hypothetical protein GCM10010517_79560 [Streptosporangium fragile]|uniref:SDR family NAD(P)-dependent oxidoreductase n=1 Tax=Streptosporangium fragile TaxID=46186 RepID=A0ABN3WED6_9ACTN
MAAARQVIVVTGASSGFGRLTAVALARAGHAVVAGMRRTADRNAPAVAALDRLAADEIVRIVDLPAGRRPFRSHVDPGKDGSEVVSTVADRIRAEFYHRAGIADLLSPTAAL